MAILTTHKVTRRLRDKLASRKAEPLEVAIELQIDSLVSLPKTLLLKEASIAIGDILDRVGLETRPESHQERVLSEQKQAYRKPASSVYEILCNYSEIEIDNSWVNEMIFLAIPASLSNLVLDMLFEEITSLREVFCIDVR